MTRESAAICARLSDAELAQWHKLFGDWPPGTSEYRKQRIRLARLRYRVDMEQQKVRKSIRTEAA